MKFKMNKFLKKPMINAQTYTVEGKDHALFPQEGMIEEIVTDDPLELALAEAETEHNVMSVDADGYDKMLDSAKSMEKLVAYLSLGGKDESNQSIAAGAAVSKRTTKPNIQLDDPWSELKAPKIKLKSLPTGLRYAYLGPNSTYPVIVNSEPNNVETSKLLCELRKYRKALGYFLSDISSISPDLCMHRIHLEDESMASVEHQRRLNRILKMLLRKR